MLLRSLIIKMINYRAVGCTSLKQNSFTAASPDSILLCSSHGRVVAEIKYTHNIQDQTFKVGRSHSGFLNVLMAK